MTSFLQLIASGLMTGALYSMVAIGFVLIYKSSGVLNFAQGGLVMVGAYICWTAVAVFQLPYWLGFLITIAFAVGFGIVIERVLLRPMIGQPVMAVIMMTIALSLALGSIVQLIWGPDQKALPTLFPQESITFWGLEFSPALVFGFITAILLFIVFSIFFKYTRAGLAMRATCEDHQVARSMGIKVRNVFSQSWVISCIVSAIGGIILASITNVSFYLDFIGLRALPVVLLGGLESIPGALIGGLLIGVAEKIASGYINPIVGGGFADVFAFIIMVLVLIIRPYGLFGLKEIERV